MESSTSQFPPPAEPPIQNFMAKWWGRPLPPEVAEYAKDFKPMGSVKRLQSVIEMVFLDEQEDFEINLDELDSTVSWGPYSKDVKIKAEKLAEVKDASESFRIENEVAAVALQALTELDTTLEDETEDEAIQIIYDSRVTKKIRSNNYEVDSEHLVEQKNYSSCNEVNAIEKDIEIISLELESDTEIENCAPNIIYSPPLNLRRSKTKLVPSGNIASCLSVTEKNREKIHLVNILPPRFNHTLKPSSKLKVSSGRKRKAKSSPYRLRTTSESFLNWKSTQNVDFMKIRSGGPNPLECFSIIDIKPGCDT